MKAIWLAAWVLVAVGASAEGPNGEPCAEVSSLWKVRNAVFIGEVRLRSKREWTYQARGELRTCGFLYEADVLEVWKGDPPPRVEFHSEEILPLEAEPTYVTLLESVPPRPVASPESVSDWEREFPGEPMFPCEGLGTTRAREITPVPADRSLVDTPREPGSPLPFWIYHLNVQRGDPAAERISLEALRAIVVEVASEAP